MSILLATAPPIDWAALLLLVAAAIGLASAIVLLWALFGDRRRGRRRCPRCWHELTGIEGRTCPECGRTARRERSLHRRRVRWRLALFALPIVLTAAGWIAWDRRPAGTTWLDLVPTFALAWEPSRLDEPAAAELLERLETGNVSSMSVRRLVDAHVRDLDPARPEGPLSDEQAYQALRQLLVLTRAWRSPEWLFRLEAAGVPRLTADETARLAEVVGSGPLGAHSLQSSFRTTLLSGLGPDGWGALPAMLRASATYADAIDPLAAPRRGRPTSVMLRDWPPFVLANGPASDRWGGAVRLGEPWCGDQLRRAAAMLEGDETARQSLEAIAWGPGPPAGFAGRLLAWLAPAMDPPPTVPFDPTTFRAIDESALRTQAIIAARHLAWSEPIEQTIRAGLQATPRLVDLSAELALRHGPETAALHPTLRSVRDDWSVDLTTRAMVAVAAVASGDDPTVAEDLLSVLLRDRMNGRRSWALWILTRTELGDRWQSPELVALLLELVDGPGRPRPSDRAHPYEQLVAAYAALTLGGDPAACTTRFLDIARAELKGGQRMGQWDGTIQDRLTQLVPKGRLDPLSACAFLEDPSPVVRALAGSIIWFAGPRAQAVLPRLREMRRGATGDVRADIDACIRLIEAGRWPTARDRKDWT